MSFPNGVSEEKGPECQRFLGFTACDILSVPKTYEEWFTNLTSTHHSLWRRYPFAFVNNKLFQLKPEKIRERFEHQLFQALR